MTIGEVFRYKDAVALAPSEVTVSATVRHHVGDVCRRECKLCHRPFAYRVQRGPAPRYCRSCRQGRWDTRAGRAKRLIRIVATKRCHNCGAEWPL